MELDELIFVLSNCFDRNELQAMLGSAAGDDPYRSAAKLILEGDDAGERLCERLDRDAAGQRKQIKDMTLPGLRSSLSPAAIGLMGSGPNLGQLIWALLRDGRVGAAHIAHEVVQSKTGAAPTETGVETFVTAGPDEIIEDLSNLGDELAEEEDASGMDDFDLGDLGGILDGESESSETTDSSDVEIADIQDINLDLGLDGESEFEEVTLDQSIGDIGVDDIEIPDLSAELSDLDDLEDGLDEELSAPVLDGSGMGTDELLGGDDVELDLDFDLSADEPSPAIAKLESDEELFDDIEVDVETLISEAEDILPALDEDMEQFDEFPSDSFPEEEELDDRINEADSYSRGMGDDELTLALEEQISALSGDDIPELEDENEPQYVGSVELAGIRLPLSSLHKACEKVFAERVELITDDELIAEDKVAVVGRRCGIKILHGPSLAIETPDSPATMTGERVRISPVSLEAALAKVFNEEVQLVPDPRLLSDGIVAFAGRHCGIVILRNDAAEVPVPPWVDPELSATIQAATDAMTGQADWATIDVARLVSEHEALNKRCSHLEEQVEALMSQGVGVAVSVPEPAEEESEEEIHIPVETEIPTSEPEPAPEPEFTPEPMPEITEELTEEPELELEGELDLGDVDLSGVLEDELTEDTDVGDIDLGAVDEGEGGADELDLDALGDLDVELGDLGGDAGEAEAGEEGELDLDMDLDVDAALAEAGEDSDDGLMADVENLLAEAGGDEDVGKVLNGELVLILGGEEQNREEYGQVVEQIGGACEWFAGLADMGEGEIQELVDRADIILTLADAITDPGILQATDLAQQSNKRCFAHHSSAPSSVRSQLIKLVQEGKV